jgi:hypothetical protein
MTTNVTQTAQTLLERIKANTLSPEDTMFLSKAVASLMSNGNYEQALVSATELH